MRFSAEYRSQLIGNCATGIVYNTGTAGWFVGSKTLIEIAIIQRRKDSEKANCF